MFFAGPIAYKAHCEFSLALKVLIFLRQDLPLLGRGVHESREDLPLRCCRPLLQQSHRILLVSFLQPRSCLISCLWCLRVIGYVIDYVHISLRLTFSIPAPSPAHPHFSPSWSFGTVGTVCRFFGTVEITVRTPLRSSVARSRSPAHGSTAAGSSCIPRAPRAPHGRLSPRRCPSHPSCIRRL